MNADATPFALDPALLALPRACTFFQLRKLTRTVSRLYDRHLATAGLKTTQFSVLAHVHVQALPMTQLSALLGAERTTLTRNLKPLAEAGWVTVTTGADPRQRIVAITEAGRAKVRHARQAWRAAQDEIGRLLGETALQALHADVARAQAKLDALETGEGGGCLRGGEVKIRPVPGQAYSPSLRVHGPAAMRDLARYPLGTRFRVSAKLTDRLGGTPYLYVYPGDPVSVMSPEQSRVFLAEFKRGRI
jgi:DNA-binding MarR family transcriptional regulator